jgi:hypothetical protein
MEVPEEQKERDTKRILIVGAIVLLVIVMIVSHLTADALGARLEQRITSGQTELDRLVQSYSDQVSALVLGTKPRPEPLVAIIRTYFVEPPEPGHELHLFEWMEEHNVAMSDLRHEKIQQLITAGRKIYQEQRLKLRETERHYIASLDSSYRGFWLHRNGYPRIELQR